MGEVSQGERRGDMMKLWDSDKEEAGGKGVCGRPAAPGPGPHGRGTPFPGPMRGAQGGGQGALAGGGWGILERRKRVWARSRGKGSQKAARENQHGGPPVPSTRCSVHFWSLERPLDSDGQGGARELGR